VQSRLQSEMWKKHLEYGLRWLSLEGRRLTRNCNKLAISGQFDAIELAGMASGVGHLDPGTVAACRHMFEIIAGCKHST
jgi:hypothetical protein